MPMALPLNTLGLGRQFRLHRLRLPLYLRDLILLGLVRQRYQRDRQKLARCRPSA